MKKTFAVLALAATVSMPAFSYAETTDPAVIKADVLDAITRLVKRYEARIAELETENAKLKAENAALKTGKNAVETAKPQAPAATGTVSSAPATPSKPAAVTTGSGTGNAEYDAIIKDLNANFVDVLRENGLPGSSQLGLFEFVQGKRAVFVSIDDGKNPPGVTAFKTKILFSYDADLVTSVAGVFDLNYDVQKYKTVFGSNPYSTAVRIKIKNPAYKGKLLDEAAPAASTAGTSVGAAASSSATPVKTPVSAANATAKDVRAAYDKNKLKDAVTLADAYLAKNPDDVEILTIRYRSLYILGRFADSLKDVQAIERVQGSSFDCTIAKDAAFIAKSAKNADLAAKYGAMCKKQ